MARRRTIGWHYAHGLRAAVRFNAQAFAFSIMITSSFGVVSAFEGPPGVAQIYAFMAGAVLGFVVVLAAATNGFRRTGMESEPTEVLAVAAALALGSTASGLGAATLVAWLLTDWPAWALAPFAGSASFLLVLALEFAVAEAEEE